MQPNGENAHLAAELGVRLDITAAVDTTEVPVRNEWRMMHGSREYQGKENIKVL